MSRSDSAMGSGRTFTFLWFAIALVLFVASGVLTRNITAIERTAPQLGYAVFLTGDDGAPLALRADVGDHVIGLHVAGTPDAKARSVMFGPVPRGSEDAVACTDARSDATIALRRIFKIATAVKTDDVYQELGLPLDPDDPYRSIDLFYRADDVHAWPFFAFDLAPNVDVDIACRLPNVVIRETFATRALTLVVGRGGERAVKGVAVPVEANAAPIALFDPQAISVRDADARDARVADETSGREFLGSVVGRDAFAVDPERADAVYRFSWESVTAGQERDVVLVVIGSLIALGAAAAIEAGRPFIESIGERKQSR